MSCAFVAKVEALGVDAVQHVHACGQVCLGRLDDEVVVRAHQAEGVAAPRIALDDVREEYEEQATIVVVPEDHRARHASRDDVEEPVRQISSKAASHDLEANASSPERQPAWTNRHTLDPDPTAFPAKSEGLTLGLGPQGRVRRGRGTAGRGHNGRVQAERTDTRGGWGDVAAYVRSLGLDAYLVGGAVRDELLGLPHSDQDFVVPGTGYAELRALLAPHGRVEDLEVAGQRVGLRLFPRDRAARTLAPAGIEFAPPRAERSTGPGRHDFAIVADPSLPLEADMERRDFTVNAMARSLATGELVDPFGGRADLERRVLRTVTTTSFRDDPLRIVRGLRLISQLDLDPDPATLEQMREHAPRVRLVSGERIGGGLAADGLGELSKLLLGARPAKALRIARDTGVLTELIPEFAPAIGLETSSSRQHLPADEHIFEAVQFAADDGAPLAVRLALLLHDLGKPASMESGEDHARLGAAIAGRVLRGLRYPNRLHARVVRIVRHHAFTLDEPIDGLRARRFLAEHGEELARDLVAHKRADLRAKTVPPEEHAALERFGELLERERENPHRLADLAVDGADLIALGFREGPPLGDALRTLLGEVVEEPARNTRERLTERARGLLEAP
jgi:tRNA nucleotidyltransferase/poly(A) polymerase